MLAKLAGIPGAIGSNQTIFGQLMLNGSITDIAVVQSLTAFNGCAFHVCFNPRGKLGPKIGFVEFRVGFLLRKRFSIEFCNKVWVGKKPCTVVECIRITRFPIEEALDTVIAAIDIMMFCIGAERFIAISHSKAVNIIERMCNHILTNLIDQHLVLKLLNLLPEGTNMNIVIDKFKLIDTNKFFPAFDNVLANMPFFFLVATHHAGEQQLLTLFIRLVHLPEPVTCNGGEELTIHTEM